MPSEIQRQVPNANQESVWDYPRPPRVEPTSKHIRVVFNGVTIADTTRALRVLETSHPPTYYLPLADIKRDYLIESPRSTYCEWKDAAAYYTIRVGDKTAADAAWYYPQPSKDFAAIKDHVAFYAGRMDACYVNDELVRPQGGGFYGGWITSDVVGPFKGDTPDSIGW
ncbi:MAG: DUF427 domain-containing protein [Anaerolineae bacterium]|nr:DUF427 domain-containing protein [Anaerolineae bacterium]